jgi:sialate O-acetylesterase
MQLRIPIKWFFIPVLSLILQASIYANVRVARIFSDNMVLQRDINAPVWGSADPGEQVSVTIDGLTVSTRAEADGSWRVYLPVFTAGGPYEVVVSGKNEVRFTDVLFGDVWVASGQSNMEWRLENSNNGQQEVNDANYPQIRMFYVPKRVGITPKDDLDGRAMG